MPRLNININNPTSDALNEMTEFHEVTQTEIIRRAVGTTKWLDDAIRRGARIQIVERDGQVIELVPSLL